MYRCALNIVHSIKQLQRVALPAVLLWAVPVGASADDGATLTVEIVGVSIDAGQVQVGLYLEETFPEVGRQLVGVTVPARSGALIAQLESVPAGTYAIAVYHDTNSNELLDTNLFGVPTEDYAFSNDARGLFGPPDFKQAAITISGDTQVTIGLR